MAIKEIKVIHNGLGEFLREFVCDLESELTDLPGHDKGIVSGSSAICAENKKKYLLSVAGEWKEAPPVGVSEEEMALKADLVGGKVPAEQLPSYVDDVMEFPSFAEFPVEGEEDKIYVDIDAKGATYRWSGTMYIPLQPALVDGGEWA